MASVAPVLGLRGSTVPSRARPRFWGFSALGPFRSSPVGQSPAVAGLVAWREARASTLCLSRGLRLCCPTRGRSGRTSSTHRVPDNRGKSRCLSPKPWVTPSLSLLKEPVLPHLGRSPSHVARLGGTGRQRSIPGLNLGDAAGGLGGDRPRSSPARVATVTHWGLILILKASTPSAGPRDRSRHLHTRRPGVGLPEEETKIINMFAKSTELGARSGLRAWKTGCIGGARSWLHPRLSFT